LGTILADNYIEVKDVTNGTVIRWLDMRGYGFIKSEDGKEVFAHNSEIQGKSSLTAGEKVEFEVTDTGRGPRAVKIKSVSE
jgi:CspA family cold shock protein